MAIKDITEVDRFVITNAPPEYDYRGVDEIVPMMVGLQWHGRSVRYVRIPAANDATYQVERYRSGLYLGIFVEDLTDGALTGPGSEDVA